MEREIIEYNTETENLFIEYMLSNPELFARCANILKDSYFDDKTNRDVVKTIGIHFAQYSSIPTIEQIKSQTSREYTLRVQEAIKEDRWFLTEIEYFCKYKALKDAILSSPELLDEGRYGEVETMVKSAVQIALVQDLGTDYYHDPKSRLEAVKEGNGQLSTGWKAVDEKLYGGFNKGELAIFAGQSGAGKSLVLQNLAVNWSMAGLNVVYLSLELSEKLCAMRVDAMHTDYGTKEVLKNIEDVAMRVRALHMKHKGNLQIKQLPNGCTANDIRAYIKEYEIHKNVKVDCLLVDYLDLMMPVSKKISAENLFVKDKYVTEELRNLAVELQLVTVSASQLNRCVAPDTKVEIEGRGLIDIEDVIVGDKILSHTGYNIILDKWKNQKQHVYKITLLSGKSITCSMYHRFPTYKGLNTLENGLATGDHLLVAGENTIMNREPIVKVEYVGEMETIDITTDRDHMFYGNGILTHNTSYEEIEFDPSHIAGGISKVNTADNVIGIFTSAAMKESGRYQIQFMKTRSSSGVGSKVDLAFCNKSLRITDLDECDEGAIQATTKNLYETLKKKGNIKKDTVDPDTGEIMNKSRTVDPVEGAKSVRDFLKSRK